MTARRTSSSGETLKTNTPASSHSWHDRPVSPRDVVVYELLSLDGVVAENILEGLPPIRLAPVRNVLSPTGYLILDYRVVG